MKKIVLASSLLLSLTGILITPIVQADSVTVRRASDKNINTPGVKISGNSNRSNSNRGNIKSNGSSDAEPDYMYPDPVNPQAMNNSVGSGAQSSAGGFTGSKSVDIKIPNANPQPQYIKGELPQSFNDMENKARSAVISQGQVPFKPPSIIQGSLQNWNTTTIKEMENKGIADTQKKYEAFRYGQR